MEKIVVTALVLIASLAWAGVVWAESVTGNIEVSVTVNGTVSVTTTAHVDFGTVTAGAKDLKARGQSL